MTIRWQIAAQAKPNHVHESNRADQTINGAATYVDLIGLHPDKSSLPPILGLFAS
jgi:hypothetical protein